ncbi:MAG: tetratricopeptide repeat protein, partial [Spirochaetia bacterium]
MRSSACFLALFFSLACSGAVHADNANKYWLLYEQGNTAADQKEYGRALQLYKDAIEGAGIFPEAEAAIGDVYLAEGEASLAQRQYQKAYELRKSFYIPEKQYDILYKLANLFEMQQQYKQMEDSLTSIVQDDKRFQDTPNQRLRAQLEKNYFDKGLDRVLVLYNFDDSFAAVAHSKLGWFYYRTGRFAQSVSQLLYSVVYRVSQIERARKERDVDYEYTTFAELLAAVNANAELKDYATSTGLFRDLYYLAGSTFADGFPQHATIMWKLLTNTPAAAQYKELSARQLKKPFVEP